MDDKHFTEIRTGTPFFSIFSSEKVSVQKANKDAPKLNWGRRIGQVALLSFCALAIIPICFKRYRENFMEGWSGREIRYIPQKKRVTPAAYKVLKSIATSPAAPLSPAGLSTTAKSTLPISQPSPPQQVEVPPPVATPQQVKPPPVASPPSQTLHEPQNPNQVAAAPSAEAVAEERRALSQEIRDLKPQLDLLGYKDLFNEKMMDTDPKRCLHALASRMNTDHISINTFNLSDRMLEIIAPKLTFVGYKHDCTLYLPKVQQFHHLSVWPKERLIKFLEKCSRESIQRLDISHPEIEELPYKSLPECDNFRVLFCSKLHTLPDLPWIKRKNPKVLKLRVLGTQIKLNPKAQPKTTESNPPVSLGPLVSPTVTEGSLVDNPTTKLQAESANTNPAAELANAEKAKGSGLSDEERKSLSNEIRVCMKANSSKLQLSPEWEERIDTEPEACVREIARIMSKENKCINTMHNASDRMLAIIAPELTVVNYDHGRNRGDQTWPLNRLLEFLKKCSPDKIQELRISHPEIEQLPFDELPVCKEIRVSLCKKLLDLPELPALKMKIDDLELEVGFTKINEIIRYGWDP